MPNIGALLKEEISRLSRKETRSQLEALKRASAQYRQDIAALRRQVLTLEREVARLSRQQPCRPTPPAQDDETTKVRFSAKGLRSSRERLGLSAADYGKLVGVTAQSVYNWERGATAPRGAQLQAIADVRGIGKREARARLEALSAQAPARGRARRKAATQE
jgi:DNA-binding transcriptional regulator YiaG